MSTMNRRGFLRASALALAAGSIGAATVTAPQAAAQGPILGTVIDYAAGVPKASSIKAAGHLGAVRYVSQRRPGANWMIGKPVTLAETRAMAQQGLQTASVYQFGRADTADWLQGAAGAAVHAPQAIALHVAAGGPTGRPIYVAIDDNPTRTQYVNQIRPYLQAFQAALRVAGYQTGVYGNYHVIDWAIQDGIGTFFWMHDWGSGGKIHPRTTIHQLPQNKQRKIDGVTVDINNVYARDWGQWTPGQAAPVAPPAPPAQNPAPQHATQLLDALLKSSSL
ncbi:MAG: DUF1906 domain-containing protein [Corynebacterium sp.]|uniref:DUF1906 domain-containing protein n=1 Tax=Corynebacterium sp. TaxID=1720 RepID=UPI0026E0ED6B|nr:DUF1906 domain-containing protein [Corynebacterium sp.]MDO5671110.1 DUF1906 domain-containing protein [Corynebacterium sp.]